MLLSTGLIALSLAIAGYWLVFVPLKVPQELIDLADPQHHATDDENAVEVDAELLAFLMFDSKSAKPLPANLKKMTIEKNIEKNAAKSK